MGLAGSSGSTARFPWTGRGGMQVAR
jgi:hypothetical protein